MIFVQHFASFSPEFLSFICLCCIFPPMGNGPYFPMVSPSSCIEIDNKDQIRYFRQIRRMCGYRQTIPPQVRRAITLLKVGLSLFFFGIVHWPCKSFSWETGRQDASIYSWSLMKRSFMKSFNGFSQNTVAKINKIGLKFRSFTHQEIWYIFNSICSIMVGQL